MNVKLTPREQEVLALMAEGKTNKEIGEQLFIGQCTVNTHIEHITDKFCVEGGKSTQKAVILALQQGLLDLSSLNII